MGSWRDSTSKEAQNDFDGLLNAALPFATDMLRKHQEFFPFGAAIDRSGSQRMIAADPGLGEQPPSLDVLAALVAGMRGERDSLRAVALVADVRLTDSDAVRVELEHREGSAIAIVLPYKVRRLRRGLDLGELKAAPGSRQVWDG
jgi:hypothetical protein